MDSTRASKEQNNLNKAKHFTFRPKL